MGARPTGDGLSATAFPSGIRGVPAEVIESISPVVMHKRELRPDSEGPGRYRGGGGFGQEMEIGVRSSSPWTLSAMYDRTTAPGVRHKVYAAAPRGHGNGAHFGRHRPAPETAAADRADERVILSLPGGERAADIEATGRLREEATAHPKKGP